MKVSSPKKISIHVADLEDPGKSERFNVSVRCDSNEGLLQNSEIKRISGAKDYFQVKCRSSISLMKGLFFFKYNVGEFVQSIYMKWM